MSNDVDDFLAHYGVKGMKWGVRKDLRTKSRTSAPKQRPGFASKTITMKNGDTLKVTRDPEPLIVKALSRMSTKYKAGAEKHASFSARDKEGKRIGTASISQTSPEEINLIWLGIKKSSRGQGYASAIINEVINYGKSKDVKLLTLEVPGNAPDALHIYEKQGFKVTGILTDKDDIWGGLTTMERKL